MELGILGPLEARDRDRPVALGGPRQRALLAYLALHAGEVISVERLLDAVWGERRPASGTAAVQVRVSQLRKAVGPRMIRTHPPGYVLDVQPGELDSERFRKLAADGRQALARNDLERAAEALSEALALWRGEALADVTFESPEAVAAVMSLAEARCSVAEDRVSADLAVGRHEELVAELETLVAEEPMRERRREQLMLALYRSGRQGEALAAFRAARETLIGELGIEPSRRLKDLENAILRHDASLELPVDAGSLPARALPERKRVTVLAADVVPDKDPERTDAWFSRLREVAIREVQSSGGSLEAATGGGVLVAFGAHAAQEDHAAVALEFARALRDQLGGILPLRLALDAGDVLVHDAGVTGAPVVTAARMLLRAAPGEILASERVKPPHRSGADRSPFVGRGAELGELIFAFRRARDERRPRLVTLIGDAGVGKSRLVRELQATLETDAPETRLLLGRCLPYGRGVTYQALGEVLRALYGLSESEPPEKIVARLAGREIAGLTLGLDVAGDLHPLAALERLRASWVELITEVVAERPAVMVIEDLHWAHPDLLDLLDLLIAQVDGSLMVVSTARPELLGARPSWGRHRDSVIFWLEPLAPADAARLVQAVPSHLRALVLERAEGNPLFIEELLARAGEGDGLDPSAIPDSVQAVLAARIDELPPLEKEALQAASVIGRSFWREPVREMLGDRDPSFTLLEERDLVRPRPGSSLEGMRELTFKHALTCEVAYSTLTAPRRARLHAAFARWLENSGERGDQHAALLAHHYAEAVRPEDADLAWAGEDAQLAELRERARAWLRTAAELATGRYEIAASIALLSRALELETDDAERCAVWRSIARANALRFDGEAFWKAMENAVGLAPDEGVQAEIVSQLAVQAFVRAGMWTRTPAIEQIDAWVSRALALAHPGTPSRARALIAKASLDLDDRAAATEAAAIVESLDDPELCVYAWDACATTAMVAADYESAWRWRTRRLDLLDRVSDPDLRTIIAETPYASCVATCRFDQARAIARLHDELTSTLTPHHRLHGAAILVEVEELLGGWEAIRAQERRVADAVLANASSPCLRNARSLLVCAVAAACLGDDKRATELERAADGLGLLGRQVLDAPRLRLALLRGDRDRAEQLLAGLLDERGWYARGHGTSLATLTTRLDALALLGHGDRVELEAPLFLREETYVKPFAMRALGIARGDRALIEQAIERFARCNLSWHASQTRALEF